MRPISELAASALTGSQGEVRLVVDAWRDGVTVAEDLPVDAWEISWDATRQVQAQARLSVSDESGELGPWAPDDPLGAGGTRLRCRYRMVDAGHDVQLEWLRLVRPETAESWRIHPGLGVWLSTGASVSVNAESLTWQARAERLMGPQAPTVTGSTLGEVAHLLQDIIPLGSTSGITDRPVPASIVYGQGRMDAVEALLASLGATHRMSADGLLDVVPVAGAAGDPWVIAGGDEGVLVDVSRSQDAAELFNAAVSTSTTDDGRQLVGTAVVPAGPLRFGGPHGRVPAFHGANLAKTQAAVDADAATFLVTQTTGQRTVLPVTCLPNPALQPHDPVVLPIPVAGTADVFPLPGIVVAQRLSGRGRTVHPMTLGVAVRTDELAIVADRLRRERHR